MDYTPLNASSMNASSRGFLKSKVFGAKRVINVCEAMQVDAAASLLPCMPAINYLERSAAFCHHPIMWRFTAQKLK